MKVFFNGWYSGFLENTNPGIGVSFFIDLFKKVYATDIIVGNFDDSEILCEFVNVKETFLYKKKWENTFLFSGEKYKNKYWRDYDCFLWGQRNNLNIINLPLFIPYIYYNNFLNDLQKKKKARFYPKKDIICIISNKEEERIRKISQIEKKINIDYGGRYKNNIKIDYKYNDENFFKILKNYKFIISFENGIEDTYITEKIIHGFKSGIIPIYFGTNRVVNYFNSQRFIIYNNEKDIEKIIKIKNSKKMWFKKVNQSIFKNNKLERNIDVIVDDIKNLLFKKNWKNISRVFCVLNSKYEIERKKILNDIFNSLNVNCKYIGSTYGIDIKDEDMKNYVDKDYLTKVRGVGMKKSEISLILNYIEVLEYIVKNFKAGYFVIFESDILPKQKVKDFNNFLAAMINNSEKWDLIHFGGEEKEYNTFYVKTFYNNGNFPKEVLNFPKNKYIDNIGNYKLFRKCHTRCTDSFLWSYDSVVKILRYLKSIKYNIPFDYLMIDYMEKNINFKNFWSKDTFFIQGSNIGYFESTIQNNKTKNKENLIKEYNLFFNV